jgi:hypothetical protein
MTARIDEETPLLEHGKKKVTPLPWFQFSIVLFLQLAEPLTSQVIYPFAPQVRYIFVLPLDPHDADRAHTSSFATWA